MPKRAYAYRYFDREEIDQCGEILRGKAKNYSPTYYFGTELTAEEALRHPETNETARANIAGNGYKRLVRTRFGQMFPLENRDVVIRD